MNKDIVRQIVVILTTIATITMNILANALPLNGLSTGEISDRFEIYFVPAGYVFSIWGVIYLLVIAYTVYQALPAQRENPLLRKVGYLYVLSSAANVAWLFLWHYEVFRFTLVAMLVLLGSLIAIYLQLGIGREEVSRGFKWFAQLPFSVYLGWVTVATIANTSQLLYFLKWNGWGISPEVWTVIMLGATTVIAGAMLITRTDIAYGLVIAWAVIGIALKHAGIPSVSIAAWVVVGLVGLLTAVQAGRQVLARSSTG
ncbi:MAG: tryptophan-rich sensory protein [Anaerolineae bacterium]|nr:tryptophan-rich sensory protein [Anaerolineae bacterium]